MSVSIVLASGSATRRAVLQAAGLLIVVDPPDIDEGAVKQDCRTRGFGSAETAETLAIAKASRVWSRHPGTITLGADQILECEGEWFDKPVDREAAMVQISRLSGRTHILLSAVVAMRDGALIWRTVERAELTMRPLSRAFIESYLDLAAERVVASVGGYQIEDIGIQLFAKISGDHFTILGMPLLSLLAFLRGEGVIDE